MHLGPRLMQGVSSRAKGRLARMHILAYKFLDLHRCPRIRRTQGSKIKTTCPIRHFPYSHTVQTPRETPPAHNPTHTYHGTSLPLPTQSPSLPTTSSHKPSSHRSHPFPVPRSLRAKLKPVERPCKPRLLRVNSEGCRAHALFAHHDSRYLPRLDTKFTCRRAQSTFRSRTRPMPAHSIVPAAGCWRERRKPLRPNVSYYGM